MCISGWGFRFGGLYGLSGCLIGKGLRFSLGSVADAGAGAFGGGPFSFVGYKASSSGIAHGNGVEFSRSTASLTSDVEVAFFLG